MTERDVEITRRELLGEGVRGACLVGLGGAIGVLADRGRPRRDHAVWQIDPHKCTACENCATWCVLAESAVKCVHAYSMCGRCDFCFGYYVSGSGESNTGAERQLCPTDALVRHAKHTDAGDVYHEYTIDEKLCIGCGICVKDCGLRGNGSLYLQVRHDRCLNCNECAIAVACPAEAFVRVPADRPYLPKDEERST